MFPFKGKNPLTGLWKPKNPHSLEYLKYLYNVLCKNQTVTENNRNLLVETLRLMSEILIWGDQNDSTVFDFFLEKNILSFFLRFMKQKYGRFICVQLLQTLNILFENISNETSVYYLLSNNHINSIICHRFDFSDDEVMAYYISFLKTLSFKLNKHTIHFFYNEHTNDFALYTEAIKFFNHSESMVRIAVRTITLNVYRVDDRAMLRYIRDKTAAPYFINLVWFIGNHILEMNSCVRNDAEDWSHNSRGRLDALVAEHLDHLHYLNDILCLNIDCLNDVLVDHLVNRMFIPLYVYSLTKRHKYSAATDRRPHVSCAVSLFLLSQVFLIIHHPPLVRQLADIILNGDLSVCSTEFVTNQAASSSSELQFGANLTTTRREFAAPEEPLAETLENTKGRPRPDSRERVLVAENVTDDYEVVGESLLEKSQHWDEDISWNSALNTPLPYVMAVLRLMRRQLNVGEESSAEVTTLDISLGDGRDSHSVDSLEGPGTNNQNITDEEKEQLRVTSTDNSASLVVDGSQSTNEDEKKKIRESFSLAKRPFLEAIVGSLEVEEDDYNTLFSICLLYAIANNKGINAELLDIVMISSKSVTKEHYNNLIVEELINIISGSCKHGSRIRLITLHMAIMFLRCLVDTPNRCFLQDSHLACIEGAKEESTLMLRNYFRSEEIFLDMFEDEYRSMRHSPINVEFLMMDASVLLTPTGTPLTGIEFVKRLPCGDVERARRAIRVFFLIRDLSLSLRKEMEDQLPLTKDDESVRVNDKLDLNNADLIGCTVSRGEEERKERRFLVIDKQQFLLVKPDNRRLGWGIATFAGYLQDVEVVGDKEDSRSLHVTVHRAASSVSINPQSSPARSRPLLSARFVFDDHIRCMAAKQRLTKGRSQARQEKMQIIARLLDIPTHVAQSMYAVSSSAPGGSFHLPEFSSSRGASGRTVPRPGRATRQSRTDSASSSSKS